VSVLYGVEGSGLVSTDNDFWHQNSANIPGGAEAEDRFGYALAAGDFDDDGFNDLAIGVQGESIGTAAGAGAVHVLYGFWTGLSSIGSQLWHQDVTEIAEEAEYGDNFGHALTVCDFDHDGVDDLAIGVPGETISGNSGAGALHILFGVENTGLTADGEQFWHQNVVGVEDVAETQDRFGSALAVGRFDPSHNCDLAVGVPNESVGSAGRAGAVHVFYASHTAFFSTDDDQIWHQNVAGVDGTAEFADGFGTALAVGHFNYTVDPWDDLAIGVPYEDHGVGDEDAGVVHVIYGGEFGLSATSIPDKVWEQGTDGVLGEPEQGDQFGYVLAAGDFDDDEVVDNDLAIGVPGESVGSFARAGAVSVLYSNCLFGDYLCAGGDQHWHQTSSGILDASEASDRFGAALAVGDFNQDFVDDLAVGVPGEGIGAAAAAGAVNVLYGTVSGGLTAAGNQFWYQGSAAPRVGEGEEPERTAGVSEVPAVPALHAARPNPSTGRTSLGYDVAEAGAVRLAVYDALGREVAVLVDGAREAGRHEAVLDGRTLPSGVYLVRMTTAGGFVQMQRVTLVR
jgi:hypothetical protein